MPARSADDVRIETYSGSRVNLCPLFELAEDSAAELDSYIESGRILAAVSGGEVIGHLQLTGAVDPRQVEIKNSHAGERASRLRRVLAHARRLGDNAGMAGDDSKAPSPLRWSLMRLLDGAGRRGRPGGCKLSPPLLPRPPPGPGTGPPGAGSGPWPSGQALLASGWWRGALARKRRPRPRCKRTSGGKWTWCASLAYRPRLPPGRKHPQLVGYRGSSAGGSRGACATRGG